MLDGNDVYIAYVGDGITTDFNYPNYYIDQLDLLVTVAPTGAQNHPISQTLSINYTITDAPIDGVRPNGGLVKMIGAPAIGSTVLITRRTPMTQTRPYDENDPFPAKSHEHALDKLTILMQEGACDRSCQGYADGPPSGGIRRGGGLYQEGDHFHSRRGRLGGITKWEYVEDPDAGGLVWAQRGSISTQAGVD